MLRLIVALFVVGSFASQDGKKYDLKIRAKAVKGQRIAFVRSETNNQVVKATVNGEVVNETNEKEVISSEATYEVLEVRKDEPAEEAWTIKKGSIAKGEKVTNPSFVGKAIKVTYGADGVRHAALMSGGELSAEDVAEFWKYSGISKEKDDGPSGDEMLAPKKPVAVGESWTPDVASMAKSMAKAMETEIVAKDFAASLTLKAVETKGASLYGKITADFKVTLHGVKGMSFEKPLTMTMVTDLNVVVDGSLPDGEMTLTTALVGDADVKAQEGGPAIQLSLNVTSKRTETKTTLK